MLNSIQKTFGAKRTNPMYLAILGLIIALAGVVTLVFATAYPLTMATAAVGVALGGLLILANPKSSWGTQH